MGIVVKFNAINDFKNRPNCPKYWSQGNLSYAYTLTPSILKQFFKDLGPKFTYLNKNFQI